MLVDIFDDGTLKEEPNPTGYRCKSGRYNDCIMRKAVDVPGSGKQFNCQDWSAAVRTKYDQLSKDPSVQKECCGK